MNERCISCVTVAGDSISPGGVIFETSLWMVVLRTEPIHFPCFPLLILKRHCEDMAELRPDESASLGSLMTLTAQALNRVLQPAKVYFGIYAESVKHIHVHVFPRRPHMPPGNIPNMWIDQCLSLLHQVGLKKAYAVEIVALYADALRRASLELANWPHEGL